MIHDLAYIELVKALNLEGCPICRMIEQASRRRLHTLYHEYVNDLRVRVKLHRSRGFCNWHAWLSTEDPWNDLGIAIIYEGLLNQEIREIEELQKVLPTSKKWVQRLPFVNSYKRWKGLFKRWQTRTHCPICQSNLGSALYYLSQLIDFLSEEELQNHFRASQGLCLGHFRMLVEHYAQHPHLPAAINIQLEKYRTLSRELEEFCRKYDYRFHDEPRGAEQDSWKRVIEQFAGKREVF
jgi:hypothetical protein